MTNWHKILNDGCCQTFVRFTFNGYDIISRAAYIAPTLCTFWYKYEIFHTNSTPSDINFSTPDLTFTVISVMKIQHFCLYIPEELFNTAKQGFKWKVWTTWCLFEVNRWFHSTSLKFTCLSAKINKRSLLEAKNTG